MALAPGLGWGLGEAGVGVGWGWGRGSVALLAREHLFVGGRKSLPRSLGALGQQAPHGKKHAFKSALERADCWLITNA